jgi:phage baseplate assembly protein W
MAEPIYYNDISKSGRDYTGAKDISLLSNEQALVESVRNILETEPGEKVMNPTFGCALTKYLFEPIDGITTMSIKKAIKDSLQAFETRIDQLFINVIPNEDTNSYDIEVMFNMKTSTARQSLTISLNKIR